MYTAWFISIVVIVITILFVIKSQLSSVIERTREIGILKAIGWSNTDVTNQIVLESLIQGISGGFFGCIVGSIFAILILGTIGGEIGGAQNFVSIDPVLLILGFGIAVIISIGTGFLSSLRASKLVPAEALRII